MLVTVWEQWSRGCLVENTIREQYPKSWIMENAGASQEWKGPRPGAYARIDIIYVGF